MFEHERDQTFRHNEMAGEQIVQDSIPGFERNLEECLALPPATQSCNHTLEEKTLADDVVCEGCGAIRGAQVGQEKNESLSELRLWGPFLGIQVALR